MCYSGEILRERHQGQSWMCTHINSSPHGVVLSHLSSIFMRLLRKQQEMKTLM